MSSALTREPPKVIRVDLAVNKDVLRGKDLDLKTPNNVEFLKEKLELRPQEEFEPIGRHHIYFPHTLFDEPSHPYKVKLKYGGDDEDSHSEYVFFDCVERKPNESDMSCLAWTPRIGILFT
ncbi:hypothetical protein QR680_014914 [Steinernema hermaphroditum]|uniref:Uncharacterized protein n=1 Tax=Steinernema hermaphroditum TaxID=289476 RepID=A0AA39M522_9BILA|nr:hypothetical protein QR680_014914 [Steinernema hermaphroditum]